MKLTKSQLKEIIKEELFNERSDSTFKSMDPWLKGDVQKAIQMMWHKWKSDPATEKKHINPAKKDLIMYFSKFIKGLK